ncbi:GFA family protein [Hyphomicrobium sp. 99]|uniref:GFA family protein n=1 Tax=Hyphomicrobium sp. 99 TaxID=1163419 RepID=UPI0005F82255|nr:GFA family protein [Hyphomicrobium sp. 99]
MSSSDTHSGGCQCGAVRFRVEGALTDASVCHCRMCQKAFGALYAPLVSVRGAKLVWTRGEPKKFQSSNVVQRGFCADCGTPLTYEAPDGIAIAIGAFDDPTSLAPKIQWGVEAKLPFTDEIPTLPERDTLADANAAPFLKTLVSYQHPDHDTDVWPPK